MRFEVPQFIEVEDKIFGPFTWRQFIYLIGGGGIAAVLFITNSFLFLFIGLPIGALAILLAFYPVNNRPFSVYLESMLRYMSGTKLYLWRKQSHGIYSGARGAAEVNDDVSAAVAHNMHVPTVTKNRLHALSRNLELTAIEQK
jgi:hypothetical protein